MVSNHKGAALALAKSLQSKVKLRDSSLWGDFYGRPYFHNGSADTLEAVVAKYNERKMLSLSGEEQSDLVEYLKSL